jgi:2-oxoglutarate ferredoxin oxidoreductase subunit beta
LRTASLRYLRERYTRELPTLFCPGCGNGIVLNSFIRAIDELGLPQDKVLCVSGIGCSAWIPSPYFKGDTLHTTHGRALAFATGAKVYRRDLVTVVFTGDGDGAGIGGNHLIHAARRNIEVTTILVNNMNYGMTGGQLAPTTPFGGPTDTSPYGNPEHPFNLVELVSAAGATYVARWTTYHAVELTRSMMEAIQHRGFSFIEVLSQCPTNQRHIFGLRGPMEELPARILEMFAESTYIRGRPTRTDYIYVVPKAPAEEALGVVREALGGLKAEARLADHISYGRVIRVDSEEVERAREVLGRLEVTERLIGPLEGKVELGVFVKRDRPEFTESLLNIIERAREG